MISTIGSKIATRIGFGIGLPLLATSGGLMISSKSQAVPDFDGGNNEDGPGWSRSRKPLTDVEILTGEMNKRFNRLEELERLNVNTTTGCSVMGAIHLTLVSVIMLMVIGGQR